MKSIYSHTYIFQHFPPLDIKDSDATWWESYTIRKNTIYANPKAVCTIRSMQNFYESFCKSGIDKENGGIIHEDLQHTPLPSESEEDTSETDALEELNHLHQTEHTDALASVMSDPFVSTLRSLGTDALHMKATHCPEVVTINHAVSAINQLPQTGDPFKLPGNDCASQRAGRLPSEDIFSNLCPKTTRVELMEHIEKALYRRERLPIVSDNVVPEKLETQFPTLQEQSRHWTLNVKQHAAFVLIGAALLQHIWSTNYIENQVCSQQAIQLKESIVNLLKQILPESEQLIMYLGGSGGTGKSRLIQAFVDFARRWKSSQAVVITAYAGIAASIIGGSTLHSAIGIQISLNPKDPTEAHLAAWSQVAILFVDEFSMIDAALLDLLESRARKLKSRPDRLFGGIHLIASGDLYQLDPFGNRIYSSYSYEKNCDGNEKQPLAAHRGQYLWRTCLTDVIILDENLRQRDVEWADSLSRWRINQPTKADIEAVNKRVINIASNNISLPDQPIPIAVSNNKPRENGIRYSELQLLYTLPPIAPQNSDWRSRGVLVIEATIKWSSKSKNSKPLSHADEEWIRKLSTKRLKGAGKLFCVLNTPYIVNVNEDVGSGIANGTRATLQDIILKDSAAIRVTEIGGREVHTVYADDVLCLIFKHTIASWLGTTRFPTLPPGCFPIVGYTHSLTKLFRDNPGSAKITVFPCEFATIMTGHKMQGQTVDSIILGSFSDAHKNGNTGWLYVILSRVRSLSGLYLLTPLQTDVTKYKPRTEVKNEMARLSEIQSTTLARLEPIIRNMSQM